MRRVVGADDDDVLALPFHAGAKRARMHLLALEAVHAGVLRQARHAAHAGGEDHVLRPQCQGLRFAARRVGTALDHHLPLLLGVIPLRRLALAAAPVVELHQLGVALQPIADLVLRREHRPVIGKRQVGQVVVPHRVVQAQALVAVAPGVTGARILLDDERRHAEFLQPRAEDDAGLPAAEHQRIRLLAVAERLRALLFLFEPALAPGVHAMLDALGPRLALLFLEAFQLLDRRQQRPGLAADQTQQALAARRGGLEGEPAFGHAAGFAALADQLPVRRRRGRRRGSQHFADLIAAFGGLQVPGERHQVAPVTLVAEHRGGRRKVSARDRRAEVIEPLLHRGAGGSCRHRKVSFEFAAA